MISDYQLPVNPKQTNALNMFHSHSPSLTQKNIKGHQTMENLNQAREYLAEQLEKTRELLTCLPRQSQVSVIMADYMP